MGELQVGDRVKLCPMAGAPDGSGIVIEIYRQGEKEGTLKERGCYFDAAGFGAAIAIIEDAQRHKISVPISSDNLMPEDGVRPWSWPPEVVAVPKPTPVP